MMFASQIKLTPPSKAKGNASRKNIDTMIPKINSAGKDARRVAYGTKLKPYSRHFPLSSSVILA